MNVSPVSSPLPGERLLATSPSMRPFTDASWRQRLHYWPGRSLVAEALQLEQANRAGRLAWRGRQATPGIVSGLDVALEEPPGPPGDASSLANHFVHVTPGFGFAPSGEDVTVPRPLRISLDAIPIRYVRIPRTDAFPAGEVAPAEIPPLAPGQAQPEIPTGGAPVHLDSFPPNHVPWAAVLVLHPAEIGAFAQHDEHSPCELDPSRDAFADERRIDAAQLVLCQLPVPWETLPLLADRSGPTWRNRLAYAVFLAEAEDSVRQQLRLLADQPAGDHWDTVLRQAGLASWELTPDAAPSPLSLVRAFGLFPWELLGVPLALFSSEQIADSAQRRFFLDRGAVARRGGQSRPRSRPTARLALNSSDAALNPPGAGTPALWRARVDQFAAHLASLDEPATPDQATHFRYFPPAGLLPREALRLLTTQEAEENGATDRADHNEFFPPHFSPEAVPIPVEDLDAALAASASLAPLDREATSEDVRILVPVSEKSFDPHLLVVETPDPFFATETSRLAAVRQDDRQRRDHVQARRDALQAIATGPFTTATNDRLEPGQLEAEPTEPVDADGRVFVGPLPDNAPAGPDGIVGTADDVALRGPIPVQHAWLSPGPETGTREFIPTGLAPRTLNATAPLALYLRIDSDLPPDRLELTLNSAADPQRITWLRRFREGPPPAGTRWLPEPAAPVSPPSIPSDPPSPQATPVPGQLWLRLLITADDLGVTSLSLTGLILRLDGGRIALGPIGSLSNFGTNEQQFDLWHEALDTATATFAGGDWSRLHGSNLIPSRLLAPFEDAFEPTFEDDQSLDDRLTDLDTQLRLADDDVVRRTGLTPLVQRLQREVDRADDAIDLHFLKAQSNAHRARQVIMGEEAANELLTSPILNSIVESKSARVAQDKLLEAYKALPDVQARANTRAGGVGNAMLFNAGNVTTFNANATPNLNLAAGNTFNVGTGGGAAAFAGNVRADALRNDAIFVQPPRAEFLGGAGQFPGISAIDLGVAGLAGAFTPPKASGPSPSDIRAADPLVGQTFRIRTLSFAKRFPASPALAAYEFAHAGFLEVLSLIRSLPLIYEVVDDPADDPIPDIFTGPETVPAEQRNVSYNQYATATDEFLRTVRFRESLQRNADGQPIDDPSAIVARAIRRADASVLILRRLEFHTARRREQLDRARELLAAVQARIAAARARLVSLEGELAEARHDVGVARALWQEERQRVFDINQRRDAVLRDEVRFLAYVRPRTVDLVARTAPGWKLDPADAPATVPACFKRHDEPDPALQAYVDLFHNSPARWFTPLAPLLAKLDTRERLYEVLEASRFSAARFAASSKSYLLAGKGEAAAFTYLAQQRVVAQHRQKTAQTTFQPLRAKAWTDFKRDAEEHVTVGDLIDGRHGQSSVSATTSAALEQFAQVGACLHTEFAAVPPALRLAWVERFSQFDKPGLLRNLTVLPNFGRLDRAHRRRLQDLVHWLFTQVISTEPDAVNLMNDFVRLGLLLASHAPVNQIIAGHVPRPTPVKPGIQIPIRPLNPALVRVGMQFHVWQAQTLVARGVVHDLKDGEVQARVDHVDSRVTTLDTQMQVRFVPEALALRPAAVVSVTKSKTIAITQTRSAFR